MYCKSKKKIIVGLDESGRGPLAGPVMAAAIVIKNQRFLSRTETEFLGRGQKAKIRNLLLGVGDSKKLSPKKREKIFEILKNHPEVKWGTGRVSQKVIDRINIFQATKLAMKRAVKNLKPKIKNQKSKIELLLIDGNFRINVPIFQKSIIKGDEKVFLIKMASIIAKVTRDKVMLRYHKKYPKYGFDRHKGYGTKLHMAMLKKYGPCKLHRRSFSPVKNYCKI